MNLLFVSQEKKEEKTINSHRENARNLYSKKRERSNYAYAEKEESDSEHKQRRSECQKWIFLVANDVVVLLLVVAVVVVVVVVVVGERKSKVR